jgi:hypothetical protein
MGREEAYTGFWWGNLRERYHFGDPGVDGRIILTLILLTWTIWRAPTNASKWRMGFNSAFKGLRLIFKKWDVKTWTGSSWLRIGIGGRHL